MKNWTVAAWKQSKKKLALDRISLVIGLLVNVNNDVASDLLTEAINELKTLKGEVTAL